MIYRLYNFKF